MTNELTRQFFPIEAVRSREAGTHLGELYEFWRGLSRVKGGALPRDFEFMPATKVGRAMDFMITVDVSATIRRPTGPSPSVLRPGSIKAAFRERRSAHRRPPTRWTC